LSQMTSQNIEVRLSKLGLHPLEKIPSLIGNPSDVVATVYLKLDGQMGEKIFPTSALLFMYSIPSGAELAAMMQGMDISAAASKKELGEIDISALKETGNILAGTCASTMSQFFRFRLLEGLPYYACDMLQAVLDNVLAQIASKAEDTLFFDIVLSIKDHEISSSFIIVFDPEIMEQLMEKLSKPEQR
jgi:chemotaxis protein CheC